jgi:hypothetical protein
MMTMIFFKTKPVAPTALPVPSTPLPNAPAAVDDRKSVDEAVTAGRKRADTDGAHRRKRRTVDDNRLL